MARYPVCRRHGVLRVDHAGRTVVSTMALYRLLGNSLYQRAAQGFRYGNQNYPMPDSIECFLKEDAEAKQRIAR